MEALIFDCDGVLVDTERDGHRVAFNMAFTHKNINVKWSIEEYKELLKVAGGKESIMIGNSLSLICTSGKRSFLCN